MGENVDELRLRIIIALRVKCPDKKSIDTWGKDFTQNLNWITKDDVSHLNHFLSVLERVHRGLCQHDFALLRVNVHLLLPECVILKNGKMSPLQTCNSVFKCLISNILNFHKQNMMNLNMKEKQAHPKVLHVSNIRY